jgi:hypothetical protein
MSTPFPTPPPPTRPHAVVDNLRSALAQYNPAEAWYLGAPSEYYFRVLDLGGFNYGGAGIILSRGAMRIIAPNLARCAALSHEYRLSDATMAKCVLAHGIPPTVLQGLHQNDMGNVAFVMENHPFAPMLSLHRPVPMLPSQALSYLQAYPQGLAQRSFCMIPELGRLQVSAGYSVLIWDKGANGTRMLQYHLPSIIQEGKASTNLATRRVGPKLHLPAANVSVAAKPGGGDGRSWVVTTYSSRGQQGAGAAPMRGLHTVVVREPLLAHRWAHAPTMLCCTAFALMGNGTVLVVHLDDNHHGSCLLDYQ